VPAWRAIRPGPVLNEQVVEAHTLLVLACGATGHGWRWMDHGRLSDTDTDTDTDRLSVVGTCLGQKARFGTCRPVAVGQAIRTSGAEDGDGNAT
jgi:hypothetical protein